MLSLSVCKSAVDLGLLIDRGRSRTNSRIIIRFIKRLLKSFMISSTKTRVGAVLYKSRATPVFRFGRYRRKASVLRALRRSRFRSGRRYTGRALRRAARYLFRGRARCGRKRVLIVITDGKSVDKVQKPAVAVQKAGVEVIVIGVGRSTSRKQLLQMASSSGHVISATLRSLHTLVEVVRRKACSGEFLRFSHCANRPEVGDESFLGGHYPKGRAPLTKRHVSWVHTTQCRGFKTTI